MMTTFEAKAHLTIIDVLARALAEDWHWAVTRDAVWKPLEAFAPRCNCGLVLRFGPTTNGTRMVICRCGWGCWESAIWQGVPKVELADHVR